MLEQLQAFFFRFGHCYVPVRDADYQDLYAWCQRLRESRSRLSEKLIAELDRMGFDWHLHEQWVHVWMYRYHQLRAYYQEHGHSRVSKKEDDTLHQWILRQRNQITLSSEQVDLLNQVGFRWKGDIIAEKEAYWQSRYKQLKAYYQKHGDCFLTAKDDAALYKWVVRQRSNEASLSTEQQALLRQINFPWQEDMQRRKKQRWYKYYEQLKAFQEQHGHLVVPVQEDQYHSLALWVQRQRDREADLPENKHQLLDQLGFRWKHVLEEEDANRWPNMYEQLCAFVQEHGHARVSCHSSEHPQLANWVGRQRFRKDQLSEEQQDLLNQVGFAWQEDIKKEKQQRWQQMYEHLVTFYQEHGHCRVPNQYPPHPELGRWVEIQRKNQRLSEKRRQRLDAIDFTWSEDFQKERKQVWNKRYARLKAFYQAQGHTQVPEGYAPDTKLATWVVYLRQYPDRLTKSQHRRLEEINFAWDLQAKRDAQWMEQYRKLVAFKRKQGHTRVPITYQDQKLAKWVAKQRRSEKKLSEERRRMLNQIGFTWFRTYRKVREERWQEKLSELQAFREKYGHCRVPYDWPENKQLARWVANLRRKKDKLEEEKIAQLDALGFIWDAKALAFQKFSLKDASND